LERRVRRHRVARSPPERCRVILRCADGLTSKDVAAEFGHHEHTVGKWRRRFLKGRCDGLLAEARPGRPRTIPNAPPAGALSRGKVCGMRLDDSRSVASQYSHPGTYGIELIEESSSRRYARIARETPITSATVFIARRAHRQIAHSRLRSAAAHHLAAARKQRTFDATETRQPWQLSTSS